MIPGPVTHHVTPLVVKHMCVCVYIEHILKRCNDLRKQIISVRKGMVFEFIYYTRWWFQTFLIFIPTWGREMIQFDQYFSKGLKPPPST